MTQCDIHPGEEKWVTILGACGYEVSNRGDYRSVDRTLADGRRRTGQPLTVTVSNRGYALMKYTMDSGKQVTRTVHSVQLESFQKRTRPRGMEACHADDNPLHNCWPENVRWDTSAANTADRMRNSPAAPPKPPRICVRCGRNPVTKGSSQRCHPCVVELGELFGDGLRRGETVSRLCQEHDYPSAEGAIRLAERYGGYGAPLPSEIQFGQADVSRAVITRAGHGKSPSHVRLLVTLRDRLRRRHHA